jgi:probable HAF family extracellular repeat protein
MERSRMTWIVAALVLSAASWTPPARAVDVRYTVTDLSAILESSFAAPESVTHWSGMAINDHGQIAGRAETTYNRPFAFVWDEINGLRDFSHLEGASWPGGLNDLGQLTLEGSKPYVWDPNTGLREITDWGSAFIMMRGINDSTQLVGTHPSQSGQWGAFLWQNGNMQDLGTLGGEQSYGHAVNNLGQVVGDSETSGWPHAFLWDPEDGMRDLGSFGKVSSATDINDHGQIAGYSSYTDGRCHACVWEDMEIVDIDPLGTISSRATAINNLGQVVGNYDGIGAFLWDEAHGIANLNDLIAAEIGWTIDEVYFINDDGWIVGGGIKNAGTDHPEARAILLRPVPEPSTLVLLFGVLTTITFGTITKNRNREGQP